MTAATSQLPEDIINWHCRFAHLNQTYLKHLPSMISGMKILSQPADLPFCPVCVESKMTRQPYHDAHIPSDIPGYHIHADVEGSLSIYVTWKGYW